MISAQSTLKVSFGAGGFGSFTAFVACLGTINAIICSIWPLELGAAGFSMGAARVCPEIAESSTGAGPGPRHLQDQDPPDLRDIRIEPKAWRQISLIGIFGLSGLWGLLGSWGY